MSSVAPSNDRYAEIASFLRSRRERLSPAEVGLPAGSRRRVKGLRREEVALLADVGTTWYTWLEQGRPIAVSDELLSRIASALRLDTSELEYLRHLVRPSEPRHSWEMEVDPGIRYLVENFKDGFAYLRNSRYDWLAWNSMFERFLQISHNASGLERNALWRFFTDPKAHERYTDSADYARRLVAAFRAHYAEYVGDQDFETLIASLHAVSPDFTRLWEDRAVLSPPQWVVKVAPLRDPETKEPLPLKFDAIHFISPGYAGQVIIFGIVG